MNYILQKVNCKALIVFVLATATPIIELHTKRLVV